jgi:hypothetical protein
MLCWMLAISTGLRTENEFAVELGMGRRQSGQDLPVPTAPEFLVTQ